ncbi:protein of unknown function [Candidatus Filomicrobium marinum]|nr:protein of unknown function [Candidatus Filomicrobium marinum]
MCHTGARIILMLVPRCNLSSKVKLAIGCALTEHVSSAAHRANRVALFAAD